MILHEDKHQNFLEADSIRFYWSYPGMPKEPKLASL